MSNNAIGMIETKGYVAALAAADAMVKAANVTSSAASEVGDGLVAGDHRRRRRRGEGGHRGRRRDRGQVGELVSVHVIPRPHAELGKHFTITRRVAREPGPRSRGRELRVYLLIEDLQRQFAAYLGTPTRARGYPPFAGRARADRRGGARPGHRAGHRPGAEGGARRRAGHPVRRAAVRRARGARRRPRRRAARGRGDPATGSAPSRPTSCGRASCTTTSSRTSPTSTRSSSTATGRRRC